MTIGRLMPSYRDEEAITAWLGVRAVRMWQSENRSSMMFEVREDDMVDRGPHAIVEAFEAERRKRRPLRPFKLRHKPALRYRHRPWRQL